MEKIIVTIILVNIEIMTIQMILFELKNIMDLFSIFSPKKKHSLTDDYEI